jgi:membrane-associated protease RseP (regulator of RpoE activity)
MNHDPESGDDGADTGQEILPLETGEPIWPQPEFRRQIAEWRPNWPPPLRSARSLFVAIALFFITALSTLAAGAQFSIAYAAGRVPTFDDFFSSYFRSFTEPRLLLAGLPFAATLLLILLSHELGHFFACRYYRIESTYPYFIPFPSPIGTMGAFIRIRPPIENRRALFDMALAGPAIGFLFALPALALAITQSKLALAAPAHSALLFGHPLLERLLEAWLRPGVPQAGLLLNPVGRAAWVGLFATALNLLPAGQLDGGHILYSVNDRWHRRISIGVAVAMVPLALLFQWEGWLVWAILIIAVGFRHPPLMDAWAPLDARRQLLAVAALLIFILCFMPAPLMSS